MKIDEIKNRIPFPLPAGVRLRAIVNFDLYVPAAIIDPPGTPISDLIVLSNQNANVGLKAALDVPDKVSAIIVKMNIGDEVHLGRSSEVVIDGLVSTTAAFEVVS